jgi:hypothetical protein
MPTDGRMGRRGFLQTAALGATSLAMGSAACNSRVRAGGLGGDAGLSGEAGVSRPPNVLFILADQWRAQSIGYAGDANARTPNLDRLSSESVTFSHTVSCTPVCSPYRATLLTGRYPADTGVFLNDVHLAPDRNSLGERFQAAGYDTGYIGKWHLDGQGCRLAYTPPERRQGFSRWAAMECTHDYNNSAYFAGNDGSTRLIWPGYDATAQTREMQRWLTERDPATPFCYFLSWGPPHDPYDNAPVEFASQFSANAIQLRPNVPASFADEARASLAGYYAHMAALDKSVDELLGTLEKLGLADNTIVVFTLPRRSRPIPAHHSDAAQYARYHADLARLGWSRPAPVASRARPLSHPSSGASARGRFRTHHVPFALRQLGSLGRGQGVPRPAHWALHLRSRSGRSVAAL